MNDLTVVQVAQDPSDLLNLIVLYADGLALRWPLAAAGAGSGAVGPNRHWRHASGGAATALALAPTAFAGQVAVGYVNGAVAVFEGKNEAPAFVLACTQLHGTGDTDRVFELVSAFR